VLEILLLEVTHQPSFDQGDNEMDMGQQIGGLLFTLGDVLDNMHIVFLLKGA
jgi:hypothetical protein